MTTLFNFFLHWFVFSSSWLQKRLFFIFVVSEEKIHPLKMVVGAAAKDWRLNLRRKNEKSLFTFKVSWRERESVCGGRRVMWVNVSVSERERERERECECECEWERERERERVCVCVCVLVCVFEKKKLWERVYEKEKKWFDPLGRKNCFVKKWKSLKEKWNILLWQIFFD